MKPQAKDLQGAWQLVSWSFIYTDGRAPEYPLGEGAAGLILYTHDGHVSATLMQGQRPSSAPLSEADKAAAYAQSFAYAGRYEVRDGAVYHSIKVATNPALIGITSTRYIHLSGGELILSGPDFAADSPRTQRIAWRRAHLDEPRLTSAIS